VSTILIALEHSENRQLLAECLGGKHNIVFPASPDPLETVFDLCILDGPAVTRLSEGLQRRRQYEPSLFLPMLLIAPRRHAGALTRQLWTTVDEVVFTPIEKIELLTRVETLLRTRDLSLELNLRREDLEAFIHAMTHDLRAPLRSITGFAESLIETQASRLDPEGRHQLNRLRAATDQMWQLIGALVDFARIGRKAIRIQNVAVKDIIESCMRDLEEIIRDSNAEFDLSDRLGSVLSDPTLLKIALCNLISNSIKYVAPGVRPCITIRTASQDHALRIMIQDNGIGIAPADCQRIFTPFVRLHGVEEYAGLGLGLSSARKVVDMIGGRMGVESVPGNGATFWIELPAAGEGQ
jgi:signal transduction histidine kinase